MVADLNRVIWRFDLDKETLGQFGSPEAWVEIDDFAPHLGPFQGQRLNQPSYAALTGKEGRQHRAVAGERSAHRCRGDEPTPSGRPGLLEVGPGRLGEVEEALD